MENCAAERSETNDRPWLCGETTATLEAPSLDEGASRTGPHPGAKTVLTLASPHVGLIGALHSEVSLLGRSLHDREDFERLNPTSIAGLSATSNREREVGRRDAKSWPYPRNIIRYPFGRFSTIHSLFPIIPTSCDPYPARVFEDNRRSPLSDTAEFPLLATPFVRDIYSPSLPCGKPHFLRGKSGPQRRCGSGWDERISFPTPCGQVCGQVIRG